MNSDELDGKNGKVKVMYVRREDDARDSRRRGTKGSDRRSQNSDKRTRRDSHHEWNNKGERHSRNERDGGRSASDRNPGANPWRQDGNDKRTARRNEARPPRDTTERNEPMSPWQSSSRLAQLVNEPDEAELDHGGISGKSDIDPEVLRRQRAEETHVYGENACQALFTHRPEAIVRGWFTPDVAPRFRQAMRWLADNRKAYHVVDIEELIRASGTTHHGGVCFLIKKRKGMTVQDWLQQAGEQDCVLALDDVANPHNLGAMMRSCAHFGVRGVIIRDVALLESGAAVRTAEGGAEHVQPIISEQLPAALAQFRQANYQIVATSGRQGVPLFHSTLPKKMVLVLGQERDGVSAAVLEKSDLRIVISGTGQVDSLNVSVATGVLLSEWWRQQQ